MVVLAGVLFGLDERLVRRGSLLLELQVVSGSKEKKMVYKMAIKFEAI